MKLATIAAMDIAVNPFPSLDGLGTKTKLIIIAAVVFTIALIATLLIIRGRRKKAEKVPDAAPHTGGAKPKHMKNG